MKKNLKNIAKWIQKRITKRPVMTCLFASVLLVGILLPNIAFAASTSSTMDDALLKIQESVNIAFGVVHALFWPILLIIGSLMDNDLIFGPQIGDKLREIWVVMRNIVNIVFVFILLIIAFYNVTGFGGEGNFALKTVLPKFVIALIAVNFSFLACKVILDAANVVSVAVYDLSSAVNGDVDIGEQMRVQSCTNPAYLACIEMADSKDENGETIATAAAVDPGTPAPTKAATASCTTADGKGPYLQTWDSASGGIVPKAFCCNETDLMDDPKDEKCTSASPALSTYPIPSTAATGVIYPALNSFGTEFFKTTDQNNIGIIMAINLGSLQKLTQTSSSGGSLKDLTMNTLIATIMYIVFGAAYIALFCVLLARLVVLWLVISLSPIIALTTVMPQIAQYTSELKLGEKFVQHVTAPIVIGLSMSIGYIMVGALQDNKSGGISMGEAGNVSLSEFTAGDGTGKFLTANISDLHQLMIACIAVAIVWLGVFGAADKTLANSITNKIKDAGTGAAKFIAGLPKFIPMVPIMTRGNKVDPYSFSDITSVINKFKELPATMSRNRVDTFLKDTELDHVLNPGSDEFKTALREYDNSGSDKARQADALKVLLNGKITNDTDYTQVRNKLLAAGMTEDQMPKNLEAFDKKWKDSATFRGEVAKAYGKQDDFFKAGDFKKGTATGEPAADESATTDAAKTPQQNFVTIIGGKKEDSTANVPAAKVEEARQYIATTGVTEPPNDENIKQLIAANPTQAQLKTTQDGKKIDVVASLRAIGLTPSAAPTPPAGGTPTGTP